MSLESAEPLIAQSSPTASHTSAPRRDSGRAKRPPLAELSATGKELNPGAPSKVWQLRKTGRGDRHR